MKACPWCGAVFGWSVDFGTRAYRCVKCDRTGFLATAVHTDPPQDWHDARDRAQLLANLTATQQRCTELLEENRRLRREALARKAAAVASPKDIIEGIQRDKLGRE